MPKLATISELKTMKTRQPQSIKMEAARFRLPELSHVAIPC